MDHLIDDNDRLKPCPFCGGEATFDHDDNGWNWIECLACGASTNARVSAMDDCKPLLLEQWNKRVPSEVQPAPSVPDGWETDLFIVEHAMRLNNWDWNSDMSDDLKRSAYKIISKLLAAPEAKP